MPNLRTQYFPIALVQADCAFSVSVHLFSQCALTQQAYTYSASACLLSQCTLTQPVRAYSASVHLFKLRPWNITHSAAAAALEQHAFSSSSCSPGTTRFQQQLQPWNNEFSSSCSPGITLGHLEQRADGNRCGYGATCGWKQLRT